MSVELDLPHLFALPVELLCQILDNLDVQTILLSLRNVCTRFKIITDTYRRYNLDCSLMSKSEFHLVRHAIRTENVVALVLSDGYRTPGQISLFLSLFNIHRLTQLRSLTLLEIQKNNLKILLSYIVTVCSLTSLSIISPGGKSSETLALLSSIITKPSLRRLTFDFRVRATDQLSWPVNCTLRYLKIDTCTLRQFCIILDHLPHLGTFVLRNCMKDYDYEMISTSYRQLTSLTFSHSRMSMEELELILSLTPSLVHLKVICFANSFDSVSDGSRWERLIDIKLHDLEKFEFFFRKNSSNFTYIESFLVPYRTPFWLEYKRWFVSLDYDKISSQIMLYSSPICLDSFLYEFHGNQISSFTSSTVVNCVRHLELSLLAPPMATVQESQSSSHHLFDKVTDVTLRVDRQWPLESLEFISTLIDLSRLVELSFYVTFYPDSVPNTMIRIISLLEQARNIRSLALLSYWYTGFETIDIEDICSMVPHHVKHLRVDIKTTLDMQVVLTQFEHFLSSVTFRITPDQRAPFADIIEWLTEQRRSFTQRTESDYLYIWLGTPLHRIKTNPS